MIEGMFDILAILGLIICLWWAGMALISVYEWLSQILLRPLWSQKQRKVSKIAGM